MNARNNGFVARSLALGLVLLGAANVFGQPVPVIVRGPYLQSATTSNIIVRWRTDVPTESRVRFGTVASNLNSEVSDPTPATEHTLTLPGLAPDTKYFYGIAAGIYSLAGGPSYAFTTVPASPKPTRIWAIGDVGTASIGSGAPLLVRDAYANHTGPRPTDVWLMLGDNAYYSGTDAEYQAAVFDVFQDLLRTTPLWTTLGNHETYSAAQDGHMAYDDIFNLPQDGRAGGLPSGSERYYSFEHGNIHFVSLDSELAAKAPGSPMLTWLEQDLAATESDWIIAFWHSPPYTKGSHDSDFEGNLVGMREQVVPILETYGVDLVLCGHSHSYERSFLLNGHHGSSATLTPAMVLDAGSGRSEETGAYNKSLSGSDAGRGAVFVVAGNAGQTGFGSFDHPAIFIAQNNLGSLVIDIDGNRLDAKFLRENGQIDDHFTILKGDVPPSIVTAPQDRAIVEGGTANFTVVATGTRPLSYQWLLNGTPLADETNALLTVNNVSAAQAGHYSVVVSNRLGSVTSTEALLTVNNDPPSPPAQVIAIANHSFEDPPVSDGQYTVNQMPGWIGSGSWFHVANPGNDWFAGTSAGSNFPNPIDGFNLAGINTGAWIYQDLAAVVQPDATYTLTMLTGHRTYVPFGRPTVSLIAGGEVLAQAIPDAPVESGFSRFQLTYRSPDSGSMLGRPLRIEIRSTGVDAQSWFDNLNLTVVLEPSLPHAPQIFAGPQSQTVTRGSSVAFSVGVSGTAPLTYQWLFNDAPIDGANGSALTLNSVQLNQSGNYSVTVSNALGTATSANAVLTVNLEPPVATFDLSRDFSTTANPGGVWSYGYKTALDGTFGLNLVHQTTSGSVPLQVWSYQFNTLPQIVFNGTSDTLVQQGGTYPPGTVFYLAGNDGTELNFGAIRLTVPAGADGEYQLESIVRTYLTGYESGDTDYHVVQNGVELFGQFMASSSSGGYSNRIVLAAGDTLDFLVGRGQDGRVYGSGLVIDARLYLVNAGSVPPTILAQPQNRNALVGESVTFNVQVAGTPPITYQWRLNGVELPGANQSSLTLAGVQPDQAGDYTVVVSNEHGSVTSAPATLLVLPTPTFDLSRDFSTTANPTAVWSYGYKTALNGTFGLNLVRQTSPTSIPLQVWSYQFNALPQVWFNGTSNTFVQPNGQGTYPPGTVWYHAGFNGTEQNFGAIRLTVPPGADGEYQLDSAVRTYLTGSTSGDTDYHVVKNGVELFGQFMPASSSGGYSNRIVLASGDTLDFLVGRGQDGNVYGSGLIISARLFQLSSVPSAPTILVQPQSRTVLVGDSVAFGIQVSGTPPLSYQWRMNGVDLTGADQSSLSLPGVQVAQAGEYSVAVANALGAATSAVAVLTVNLPPSTVRVANVNAAAGGAVDVPVELLAQGNENALGFSLNFDSSLLTFSGAALAANAPAGATLVVNDNQAASGKIGVAVALSAAGSFGAGTQAVVVVNFSVAPVLSAASTPVTLGDVPTARQVSDAQARVLPAIFTAGSVSIADVDFEGDVAPRPGGNRALTITDWVQLGRFAAGLDAPQGAEEFQRADCAPRVSRGNGVISVTDWVQAGRYAVGLDPLTAVGGPTAPGGGGGSGGEAFFQAASARSLYAVNTSIAQGQTNVVPIRLEASGGENALGFSVAFDAAKLRLVGIEKGAAAASATWIVNTEQAGRIGVVVGLPNRNIFAPGPNEVVRLQFTALASAPASAALAFGDTPVLRETSDKQAGALTTAYTDGTVSVTTPPGPPLRVTRAGNTILITWPSSAAGFELEATAGALGTAWGVVPGVVDLGELKLAVIPIGGRERYFRLKKP